MSFQFPRKPEKQAFSLLKCRIKNKLLHVAVSAFHTPPRDSPKKCDKWHIWQFVAPLASSSQQPHPRTSSVAGKAHQAGRPATHTTYQATPGYSPPPEKHASIQHKDVSFWLPEPSKATPTSTHHANISITGTNRDFFARITAQRISAGTARPNPDTTAQAVPLPPEGQNPRPAAHFVPMIQIHAG